MTDDLTDKYNELKNKLAQKFDYLPHMPVLMSPQEIAIALGVSAATVQRLLASGVLHPVKSDDNDQSYLRSDIIAYIKANFVAEDAILTDEKSPKSPEKDQINP